MRAIISQIIVKHFSGIEEGNRNAFIFHILILYLFKYKICLINYCRRKTQGKSLDGRKWVHKWLWREWNNATDYSSGFDNPKKMWSRHKDVTLKQMSDQDMLKTILIQVRLPLIFFRAFIIRKAQNINCYAEKLYLWSAICNWKHNLLKHSISMQNAWEMHVLLKAKPQKKVHKIKEFYNRSYDQLEWISVNGRQYKLTIIGTLWAVNTRISFNYRLVKRKLYSFSFIGFSVFLNIVSTCAIEFTKLTSTSMLL